jgi:ABC-type sugar transport system ATPase subunit
MKKPYLRMNNITKRFPGVTALKSVDLQAYPGESLALIGANGAGKSTLMNILGGIITADEGEIYINNTPIHIHNPLDAADQNIALIHQEISLLQTMDIAENIYITNFPKRNGVIRIKEIRDNCAKTLNRLGCNIDPATKIRDLGPGDRQMVEIARALLSSANIIIFDEPTSSLTSREKERLFDIITSLKQSGVTVIYITHFLEEIFDVCEQVMVMRNGSNVGGGALNDFSQQDLVKLMIGDREMSDQSIRLANQEKKPILKVESIRRDGVLHDISFTLNLGEILGVWGLLGSGRTELARVIAGLDSIDSGSIKIFCKDIWNIASAREIKELIGMTTENRREEGLMLPLSVKKNISIANLPALLSRFWPLIDTGREKNIAQESVDRLDINITSIDQRVETLSGGNQQKVVLSRWLQKNPLIFVLDEPTRGLDVGAKAEISEIIIELANAGRAILLIMSEIDEIMKLSDRYLVMRKGKIIAEYDTSVTRSELMIAAAGVKSNEEKHYD